MSLKLPTGEDGEAFLARILRPDETLRWSSVMRWRRVTVGPGPAFPIVAAEGPREMQIGVTSRRLILLDPDSEGARYLVGNLLHEEVRLYRTGVDGRGKGGLLLITPLRTSRRLSGPPYVLQGREGYLLETGRGHRESNAAMERLASAFPIHELSEPREPDAAHRYACDCCGFLVFGFPPADTDRTCPICTWDHRPRIAPEPGKPGLAGSSSYNGLRDAHRWEMVEKHGHLEHREGGPRRRAPHPVEIPPDGSRLLEKAIRRLEDAAILVEDEDLEWCYADGYDRASALGALDEIDAALAGSARTEQIAAVYAEMELVRYWVDLEAPCHR